MEQIIYLCEHYKRLEKCLSLFPLVSQSGANAIYYAARHGHTDTLKFLHEKRCPLDTQDKVCPIHIHTLIDLTHTHTNANTSWLYKGVGTPRV